MPAILIIGGTVEVKLGVRIMSDVFPEPIRKLPLADMPLDGLKAYLSQGDSHQTLFMEFTEDAEVPEHSHEAQWTVG